MEERNNCVYKHTSPSGKVYIGITQLKPSIRWSGGDGYFYNHHFYAAIKKYGWENFTHEVVAEGLSREEASIKEKELISFYHSDDPRFGYNRTSGGDSNYTVSDSTKEIHRQRQSAWIKEHPDQFEKMKKGSSEKRKSDWSDEEYRTRIIPILKEAHKEVYNRNPNLREKMGKISSDRWKIPEYRERFIKALQSRTHSEHSRRLIGEHQPTALPVLCIDTGEVFKSVSEAARFANVSSDCITSCCKGIQETSGGFRWRYTSDSKADWEKRRESFVSSHKSTVRKKVLCIETGEVFQSAFCAAKHLNGAEGGTYQSILKCCRGERKSTHGYHWEYVD